MIWSHVLTFEPADWYNDQDSTHRTPIYIYKALTLHQPSIILFNTLNEEKNWSGRNEIIATSGRPHPSRPQNKRLYTPRTKDYRHTRQDRWIQTELAFTLVKNATKPDPVEIISLQTTRKENNWKTEETSARTVVTLETERIKLVQSLMYTMMMIKWRRMLHFTFNPSICFVTSY